MCFVLSNVTAMSWCRWAVMMPVRVHACTHTCRWGLAEGQGISWLEITTVSPIKCLLLKRRKSQIGTIPRGLVVITHAFWAYLYLRTLQSMLCNLMLTFRCNTSNSMYFCTKNCILASEETWDMHHLAICGQYNIFWCYAELRRNVLELLPPESVLQRHWASAAIPTEYFRIMDPHLPLTMEPCGHCYEQDELQMVHYTQSIYFDPAAWLEQNCLSCKVFCQ